MAIETYQFLNEAGVQKLAEQLLGKVNVRIGERIVTSIDANSSDKQVVSAKALYNLISALQAKDTELAGRLDEHDTQLSNNGAGIQSLNESQAAQDVKIGALETNLQNLIDTVNNLTHLTIETVEGDISQVADPQTDVMYLQRDDENDKTWMMYIYQVSQNPDYVEYDPAKYFTTDGAGTITGLTVDGLGATELVIPKEIDGVALVGFADNVFATAAVTNVKFMGTEDEWNALNFGTAGNDAVTNATKEFNYVLPPETVGRWINIGDTEVDLSNYWSKDSIEEMKVALGLHDAEAIPDDKIAAAVEAAFSATAVDLSDPVVVPVAITVSAVNQTINVGENVPDLTAPVQDTHYTVAGLKTGDVLGGTVVMKYQQAGVDVTPDNSQAGVYDIVVSGATVPNTTDYSGVSFVAGTLTINDVTGA